MVRMQAADSPRAGRSRGCRRRGAAVAVATLVIALLLAGCASPKSAIGPSASPCFRTLPTAFAAVGDHGHFLGVRLLTAAVVDADLEHAHDPTVPLTLAKRTALLCVAGYHGPYLASAVKQPWPKKRESGRYALVLVALSSGHVVVTLLMRGTPLRLGKL